MSKPTIVFVHGAWHTPAHFEPLSKVLQSHGYSTRIVALPSVVPTGEAPPEDIRSDIFAVKEVLDDVLAGGANALLVPHSYGGIPTTSAVKGLDAQTRSADGHESHVVGLAPIAAFIPRQGEALGPCVDLPKGDHGKYPGDDKTCYIPKEKVHDQMFNGMSEEDSQRWRDKLKSQGRNAMFLLESEYTASKDFPVHWLFCSNDHACMPDWQRLNIKKMREDGANVRVEEINADHSPYLSAIERTSDFIRRSAGESISL
ncbi:uncharacterized protein AB675_10941 [Cyphellophora attinorum]|uniref:AB hydrolase-1 domain-containing protein n=1 Tax=Cyphellophora attinorum TaxID=1664694 RepID=A0A0N0NI93_9EURO|nr:uncharacterized protein AB675_10941 [Phialophora attinorum]KPI35478.1 hypothetical protein AB675_10941 [Phialophora attinorum]